MIRSNLYNGTPSRAYGVQLTLHLGSVAVPGDLIKWEVVAGECFSGGRSVAFWRESFRFPVLCLELYDRLQCKL